MKSYFKQLNDSGEITLLLTYSFRPNITNPLVIEITKEEYETLFAEMQKHGEISESEEDEITDTEALNIITGGNADEA
ncbi:MAG: hypothetical protein IJP04_07900 [Clostridia bacterium]|nr:hypothetical protein [Clostridia bacterium]